MNRIFKIAPALMLGLVVALVTPYRSAASAENVRAEIDLSEQRLYLFVDGELQNVWRVSTARRGYRTPIGSFRPIRLERSWYSRKYDWAPMPYSVFFLGGYAIHGTTEIRRLGRPVSHGCIRLHPDNAATFFRLVRETGSAGTRIVIRRLGRQRLGPSADAARGQQHEMALVVLACAARCLTNYDNVLGFKGAG
jgi:hypothetical protein